MKPWRPTRRKNAFTLIEMLVVVAIIGILAAVLLPALNQGQQRGRRIECINNLKEIGSAFHLFAHDHDGKFPMQVPMSDGGSREFVQNGYRVPGDFYFSYRHFLPLSNELIKPELVFCPTDLARQPARNFSSLQNQNLSYFVGVTADFSQPGSILAGDRNITNDTSASGTIVHTGFGSAVHWTRELHRNKGNILFADAHVEQWNDAQINFSGNLAAMNSDFVLPSTSPGGLPASPPPAVASTPPASPQSSPRTAMRNDASGQTAAGMPAPGKPSPPPMAASEGSSLPGADASGGVRLQLKPVARETQTTNAAARVAPVPAAAAEPDSPNYLFSWSFSAVPELAAKVSWWLWLLLLFLACALIFFYARRRMREQRKQMAEEA